MLLGFFGQQCCIRLHGPKSLTGFKLYATSASKCQHCCGSMQTDATCWAQQCCVRLHVPLEVECNTMLKIQRALQGPPLQSCNYTIWYPSAETKGRPVRANEKSGAKERLGRVWERHFISLRGSAFELVAHSYARHPKLTAPVAPMLHEIGLHWIPWRDKPQTRVSIGYQFVGIAVRIWSFCSCPFPGTWRDEIWPDNWTAVTRVNKELEL